MQRSVCSQFFSVERPLFSTASSPEQTPLPEENITISDVQATLSKSPEPRNKHVPPMQGSKIPETAISWLVMHRLADNATPFYSSTKWDQIKNKCQKQREHATTHAITFPPPFWQMMWYACDHEPFLFFFILYFSHHYGTKSILSFICPKNCANSSVWICRRFLAV